MFKLDFHKNEYTFFAMRIYGATGSYPEYWIAKNIEKPAIFITDTEKRAVEAFNDIKTYVNFFKKDIVVLEYPSKQDVLDLESQIKRNFALYSLLTGKKATVVMSEEALSTTVRKKDNFLKSIISLKTGMTVEREKLIEELINLGFIREDYIENEGEFSIKGSFLSIYVPFMGIVDIDFFGDEIENIFLRSKLDTRKSINSVDIFPLYDLPLKEGDIPEFDLSKGVRLEEYVKNLKIISLNIFRHLSDNQVFFFIKGNNPDVSEKYDETYKTVKLPLKRELFLKKEKLAFVSTDEKKIELEIEPLREGDYIVHEDYGIGIYRGIETRNIRGKTYDFMILEYANNEKIYVSYLHFDKIHKYKSTGIITLDKIWWYFMEKP